MEAVLPKLWYPPVRLYSIITQKVTIWTPNLCYFHIFIIARKMSTLYGCYIHNNTQKILALPMQLLINVTFI